MKKDVIERPYYTEKVRPHIGKPIIKILTGQRRIVRSIRTSLVIRRHRQGCLVDQQAYLLAAHLIVGRVTRCKSDRQCLRSRV